MKKLMLALVAISAGLFLAGNAFATAANDDLDVTAAVDGDCHFTTAPINLASFHPGQGAAGTVTSQPTAIVTVNCTRGVSFVLQLDGPVASGLRTMGSDITGSSDVLSYTLKGAGGATILTTPFPSRAGEGHAGDKGLSLVATAEVADGMGDNINATVGDYTDTITATITF